MPKTTLRYGGLQAVWAVTLAAALCPSVLAADSGGMIPDFSFNNE